MVVSMFFLKKGVRTGSMLVKLYALPFGKNIKTLMQLLEFYREQ